MREPLIGLILLFALAGYAYAESAKEAYELQERCGKRAEERFKKEYGSGAFTDKDGTTRWNYTNHYNKKLNKCFVLVTSFFFPKDEKQRKEFGMSKIKALWDINENKEYGSFFKFSEGDVMDCKVVGKRCSSEPEWDALVGPYMEE